MGTSGAMSTSNDKVKYSITISTNWQSVSENYSSVNVKVNFWRTNSGYQTYGTGVVYCKINGTTYSASVSSSQKITSSGITLFTRDVAVGHNADGSKYLDTSAWISMDTPLSSSGVYSSTIKNYEIKINGQSFNSSNFTTNALTGSGICTIKVTDSRNKSASQNISYSVTNYSNPTINTFAVVRCNEDGTENDEGAYSKCTLKATISSVNNKNDKTFQLLYRKLTNTSYTTINLSNEDYCHESTQIIEADINNEYEFIFRASDYFSTAEKSLNLGTAFTLVDYNASGRSIAFGRVSTALENEKKIQIKLNTEIEGDFKLNSKTIFDLIYPVGSIYMSVNSTNPGDLFGGTWVTWGSGRVPVCVNTSDSNFNTVEKIGGSKSHRHEFRIGMHWWYGGACGEETGNGTGAYRFSDGNYDGWGRDLDSKSMKVNNGIYNNSSSTIATPSGKWSKGDTSNTSTLQPYITCYM